MNEPPLGPALPSARRLAASLVGLARDLAALALPQLCPGCGVAAEPARLLCDACLERIPRLAMPLCARCLAHGREPVGCLAHPGHRVWAAWVYEERSALVVQALKYRERIGLAPGLGEELARPLRPRRARTWWSRCRSTGHD